MKFDIRLLIRYQYRYRILVNWEFFIYYHFWYNMSNIIVPKQLYKEVKKYDLIHQLYQRWWAWVLYIFDCFNSTDVICIVTNDGWDNFFLTKLNFILICLRFLLQLYLRTLRNFIIFVFNIQKLILCYFIFMLISFKLNNISSLLQSSLFMVHSTDASAIE